MHVAGGLRQHRRKVSVLVGQESIGETGVQRWFERKKRTGNVAALAVWDKRKSVCCHKRFRKHRTKKKWKRASLLCPPTDRTILLLSELLSIIDRSPITEYWCHTYVYCGFTGSGAKEQVITSCKENHFRTSLMTLCRSVLRLQAQTVVTCRNKVLTTWILHTLCKRSASFFMLFLIDCQLYCDSHCRKNLLEGHQSAGADTSWQKPFMASTSSSFSVSSVPVWSDY